MPDLLHNARQESYHKSSGVEGEQEAYGRASACTKLGRVCSKGKTCCWYQKVNDR